MTEDLDTLSFRWPELERDLLRARGPSVGGLVSAVQEAIQHAEAAAGAERTLSLELYRLPEIQLATTEPVIAHLQAFWALRHAQSENALPGLGADATGLMPAWHTFLRTQIDAMRRLPVVLRTLALMVVEGSSSQAFARLDLILADLAWTHPLDPAAPIPREPVGHDCLRQPGERFGRRVP